jgi:PAS domain-containing protein
MTAEIPVEPYHSAAASTPAIESDHATRAFVDGIDAIIWKADTGQVQPVFVNQQAVTLLGYSVAQWLAEPIWTRLLYPEDREQVLALWRAAPADGSNVICTHRCRSADDRPCWFRTSLHLGVDDRAGSTD